jgi:hypothetical protein
MYLGKLYPLIEPPIIRYWKIRIVKPIATYIFPFSFTQYPPTTTTSPAASPPIGPFGLRAVSLAGRGSRWGQGTLWTRTKPQCSGATGKWCRRRCAAQRGESCVTVRWSKLIWIFETACNWRWYFTFDHRRQETFGLGWYLAGWLQWQVWHCTGRRPCTAWVMLAVSIDGLRRP